MLINILNVSKRLTKPCSFNILRTFCQNHNNNVNNSTQINDNNEFKLLAELKKLNKWHHSYKYRQIF